MTVGKWHRHRLSRFRSSPWCASTLVMTSFLTPGPSYWRGKNDSNGRLTVGAKGLLTLCWAFTGAGDLPPLTIILKLVTDLIAETQGPPDSWSTWITKVSPAQVGREGKVPTVWLIRNTFTLATESHGFLGLRKENLHTQKARLPSHQGVPVLMASQRPWFQWEADSPFSSFKSHPLLLTVCNHELPQCK